MTKNFRFTNYLVFALLLGSINTSAQQSGAESVDRQLANRTTAVRPASGPLGILCPFEASLKEESPLGAKYVEVSTPSSGEIDTACVKFGSPDIAKYLVKRSLNQFNPDFNASDMPVPVNTGVTVVACNAVTQSCTGTYRIRTGGPVIAQAPVALGHLEPGLIEQ